MDLGKLQEHRLPCLSGGMRKRIGQVGKAAVFVLVLLILALFLARPRGTNTYLVYGIDGYGSLADSGRSDAMMLVRLDHDGRKLTVISMARDMLADNGRGGLVKLNTVIRRDEENGSRMLCDTIERNFGIRPDGWFRINFSSLVSIVDAVGGVNIELTAKEANYIDHNAGIWYGYPLSEGICRLNGGQALSFVRCRYLDDDLGRGQRQSRFAAAMAKELEAMDPLRILELYSSMKHAWRSSLTPGEQLGLVWQALWSCRYPVKRISLPMEGAWRYGSANGTDGILINQEKNRTLLLKALEEPEEQNIAIEGT